MEADIGHNGGNNGVVLQSTIGNHFLGTHYQHVVAVNDISLFIYAKAAVSITIMGNTEVSSQLQYLCLQYIQMGGATVVVDIYPVWLVVDNGYICPQMLQNGGHGLKSRTVGTVQNNLHALEILLGGRQYKLDIFLYQIMAVLHSTHLRTYSTLEVILYLNGMDDVFQLILHSIRQLVAVATKELDAVVMERIVRSRNHDACLCSMLLGKIGNSRSRNHTSHDNMTTSRANACRQCRLKHRAGDTGITANKDYRTFLAAFLTKVQGSSPSHAIGQLRSQLQVCLTTNTISTKQS